MLFNNSDYYIYGTHTISSILSNQPNRAIQLLIQDDFKKDLDKMKILQMAGSLGVNVKYLAKRKFDEQFKDNIARQKICMKVREFTYLNLQYILDNKPKLCVVLDGIEDPGNLGRAIRSAFALGANVVILPKDRSAKITSAVEQSAVGTVSKIAIVRVSSINSMFEKLKKIGYWIIGTSDNCKQDCWNYKFEVPLVIAIGNEGNGLRSGVIKNCDQLVQIPMSELGISLNAADALAIILYEILRQNLQ